MGTLTKLELEAEVRAALGNRRDLDSRLGKCLNLAQQRLARLHDFDEMEFISEGLLQNTGEDSDRFIQMPTLRELYSLVLLDGANSRKLVGRTAQWMDRNVSQPEYFSRGVPVFYVLWGYYVEVFRLPQQNYPVRMRGTQWPLDLVEDTDKSQFNQKDEILIELALSYVNRTLGKDSKATEHERIAMRLVEEAKENDRTKPDETVVPGLSDSDAAMSGGNNLPWLDPFVRDTYPRY